MSKKKKPSIPIFSHPIIETHCHLDYLEAEELEQTLAETARVGVTKIMTIAVSADNLNKVLQLAQDYPQVFATQGLHPHNAAEFSQAIAEQIKLNCGHPKILAIGEIGLDYYYNKSSKVNQIRAFSEQLQLAVDLNLPVVIHSRDADEDMISILKNFTPLLKRKGVIHSFTSGLALAEFALKNDFHLGFNGIITFKNAEEVRDILKITPLEKILLETDAPYLTPIPYRGRPNAPFYLPFVAEYAASFLNTDTEQFVDLTTQNALRLFKFNT